MDELRQIVEETSEIEKEQEETTEFTLATINTVSSDGITLKIDGSDEATDKKYKCNTSINFKAGDRVKIVKESGTYVVEYIVGSPKADYPLPTSGTTGQFLKKTNNGSEWSTVDVLPSGGSSGDVLKRNNRLEAVWGSVDGGLPSGGSASQVLAKINSTDFNCEWKTIETLPEGGSTGQFLKKTYSGSEWATVPTYSGPTINGSGTSTIGFFGTSATSRKTVSKASTSATLAQLITAHNNLWQALKDYGLINGY